MGALKLTYNQEKPLLKVVQGTFLSEEKSCAGVYRYGFNGMEKDDEVKGSGNSLDFGARIYDPRIGRFFSPDPREADYPWQSTYVFAGNSPIQFVDVNGEGPGDKFSSPDEAAIDFANTYNDNSIRNNREYGSTIFKVVDDKGVKSYTYTVPNVGGKDGVWSSKGDTKKKDRVAAIHTHGAYDKSYNEKEKSPNDPAATDWNNEFSGEGGDKTYAKQTGIPLYLASSNGEIKVYDPATNLTRKLDYKDAPSDHFDPSQINKKDYTGFPDGEPTTSKKSITPIPIKE
ncbi:MAG: DUF4329 domain-containing protein [Bacteroidetes bacterium]|nr:DUF4329 domain-containing protein [Bacteroidota bacterium]